MLFTYNLFTALGVVTTANVLKAIPFVTLYREIGFLQPFSSCKEVSLGLWMIYFTMPQQFLVYGLHYSMSKKSFASDTPLSSVLATSIWISVVLALIEAVAIQQDRGASGVAYTLSSLLVIAFAALWTASMVVWRRIVEHRYSFTPEWLALSFSLFSAALLYFADGGLLSRFYYTAVGVALTSVAAALTACRTACAAGQSSRHISDIDALPNELSIKTQLVSRIQSA